MGSSTNRALGATVEAITPPSEVADLACRAARACGLDIADIDVSITDRYGPAVLEADTDTGVARGVPTLTGRDLATEMADHVAFLAASGHRPSSAPRSAGDDVGLSADSIRR
ncbi:hypothetical protein AB0B04_19375 [Streptomyces xinghaiensis]|uniref:hypothetical protein n=1 Tax=Streptomyces fradiae TaxID=1906 RepID=UPI003427B231